MTATSDFASMDLHVQTGSTSTFDAQLPVIASIYPSLEHWSSTSSPSPTSHEVLSISSLVPSTVLTLMPHYKPAANGNLYPELKSFSEVTSEPQLPETSSSPPGSSEAQDQNILTSPPSFGDNPLDIQQRKPSDGGPLEEGSVGLMLPKDLPDEEPGMEIIKGVGSIWIFGEAHKNQGQHGFCFKPTNPADVNSMYCSTYSH